MAEPTKASTLADEYADLADPSLTAEYEDLAVEPVPTDLQRLKNIAPAAKDKAIPMSLLGAALKAYGVSSPAAGWALEQLGATAQPVQRAGAPEVGEGETFLNKAVNMVPAGGLLTDLASTGLMEYMGGGTPGARLTEKAKAELAAMGEPVEQRTLTDVYRRLRDVRRARTEAGEEQNPLAALAGTGTGLGLGMLAPLPKFTPRGGEAAGLGARVGAGALTGAGYGGLAGLTSGDADLAGGDVAGWLGEGALGSAFGGTLGTAAPIGAAALRRLASGVVRPTPAAQALQREGVEGLTLGQMDPKSTIGVLEGANQSVPGFGPALAAEREAAKESFRIAALNKALPPGMEPLPQGLSVAEGMGKLQEGFNKAYRAVDDMPVPTASADRLLVRLADPKLRITSRATIPAADDAAQFIKDQMTLLPSEGTQTTAGMIREMRSVIRDEIRERLTSGDKYNASVARMLKAAEDELTDGLEKSLPDDAAKLLRSADAQYGKYKVLEDAVFKAKDTATGKGDFTPERLGISVRDAAKAGGKADYVSGGGGEFRDLEANAIQSFTEIPPTGLRALLSGGLLGRYVGAPAIYLANRPGVQPYMLGQTPVQQGAQRTAAALQRYLERLNTPPQTLAPQALFEAMRTAPTETP